MLTAQLLARVGKLRSALVMIWILQGESRIADTEKAGEPREELGEIDTKVCRYSVLYYTTLLSKTSIKQLSYRSRFRDDRIPSLTGPRHGV